MSSTLYNMTVDLDSCDWLLNPFGDHLQAWSSGAADPLTCDIEDEVVQECSNAKTLSWCESSSADLLHNPVSPPLNQAYEESAFAVELATVEGLRKERYPSADELSLKSVMSPRELLYCQSVSETFASDKLAQVVEDPLDVFGSELFSSSIQCHIADPRLNVVTTFLTDANCLIEDHLSSASQLDQIIQSFDSLQSFYVISNANRSEVSVMQQVPSSPTTSLLPLALDDSYVYDKTLSDPDTVCDLLQLLSSKNAIINHSSILTPAGSKLNSEPLLSPMSPEDIDSILSVKDEIMSSASISDTDLLILGEDYAQNELIFKSSRDSGYRKFASSLPVSVMEANVPTESRKLKKKEQNKSAANRYRQKKREEKGVVLSEVDQLQLKNSDLKARVEELNREIKYLKGLLDEIRRQ